MAPQNVKGMMPGDVFRARRNFDGFGMVHHDKKWFQAKDIGNSCHECVIDDLMTCIAIVKTEQESDYISGPMTIMAFLHKSIIFYEEPYWIKYALEHVKRHDHELR